MNVSLDQAIEIMPRCSNIELVTARRVWPERRHIDVRRSGDHEGHVVWLRVAATADALLTAKDTRGKPAKER